MALGDLVIKMSADIAQFQSDMGRAAHIANQQSKQIARAFDQVRGVLATLGVGLSVGALAAFVKTTIDAQDKLKDLAKGAQVAIATLGGLGFAGSQAGSSLEGVSKSLGKLNVSIAAALGGNEEMIGIFRNLGVSIKDLQTLPTDQIFAKLADGFAAAEDNANKAGHGAKVFGKAYQEILPLLDEGGQKIRETVEYYKRYSGVTEETTKRADEFNDQLVKLRLLSGAFGNHLVAELLPGLQLLVDKLVAAKEQGDGMRSVAQALADWMGKLAIATLYTTYAFGEFGKGVAGIATIFAKIQQLDFGGAVDAYKDFNEQHKAARAEVFKLIDAIGGLNKAGKAGESGAGFDFGITGNEGRRKRSLANLPDSGAKSAAEAAANALQKLLNEQAKLRVDALKDSADRQQALLDASYQDNLISERDYWNQSLRLAQDAAAARLKVLDDEIAQQKAFQAKQKPGSADDYNAQATLAKQVAERNKLALAAAQAEEIGNIAAARSARAYANQIEELNIQLLELQGNTAEAARKRFELQNADLSRRLGANQNVGAQRVLEDLGKAVSAQAEFTQVRTEQELVVSRLALAEERLQNALRTGAISELEALKRTGDARKDAAAQLDAYVQNLERIAQENPGLKALVLQAEQARAALEKLKSESDLLAEKFDTIFKDGFADAFADFIDGTKTMKEAFESFANSVVRSINRMVAEALAAEIAKRLGLTGTASGGASGIGGFFAGLFGGGGAAASAGAMTSGDFGAAALIGLPGYAEGTDYVPRDMLAMVHQGEAIVPADENRRGRGEMPFNPTINIYAPYDARTQNQLKRDVFEAAQQAFGRFS